MYEKLRDTAEFTTEKPEPGMPGSGFNYALRTAPQVHGTDETMRSRAAVHNENFKQCLVK